MCCASQFVQLILSCGSLLSFLILACSISALLAGCLCGSVQIFRVLVQTVDLGLKTFLGSSKVCWAEKVGGSPGENVCSTRQVLLYLLGHMSEQSSRSSCHFCWLPRLLVICSCWVV